MPWGIAVAAVGTIAGAAISGSAADSAAQTQANEQQQGINAQLQMFNTTQADYAPQIQLGQGAAKMLSGIYGTGTNGASSKPTTDYSAFYNSPGYKFSLQQGQQAINKQAAAGGGLYSTNTLNAQNNFAQGQASTQYNSYINQLLTMAGLGNAASSGVGSAATATGAGVANSYGNIGNAQANGQLGQANAFSNALGSLGNKAGGLMSNYNGGSYSGYGPSSTDNAAAYNDVSAGNDGGLTGFTL